MTVDVIRRETGQTDDGVHWENQSGVATRVVQPVINQISREIARWADQVRGGPAKPSLFNRAAYVSPDNPYAQMSTARSAVENDDIVGGVADVTEALMLQGIKWESDDPVTSDYFNQMARDLNLDAFTRQWHREDFAYSQAIVAMWWGRRQYKHRGKSETKRASRKSATIACPVALTFLDPTNVLPLKPGPFGQERLVWHATKDEYELATATPGIYPADPVLAEFTMGPANITDKGEIAYIQSCGMDYRHMLRLNPSSVVRFSRTKMPYERFSPIRLRSVFPLLDLKQQLMEADRVSLVGAANFILLVKQGSDQFPASQPEIDNLKDNFKVVAKLPVVIGDHRLNIEIITPDQEHVLAGDKYDVLDRRILNRTLGALSIGGSGQRNESTVTIARGVARLLESRRHMMKRELEEHIARRVVEHPENAGIFDSEPNLVFTPRNVQLDSDSEVARGILALRTQKELSRESVLEYFGFDQATEALRRQIEEEEYDDTFQTVVPFSSPDQGGDGGEGGEPAAVSGARGGRPPGGGDSPQSPQGQTGGRSAGGRKTTKK